MTLLRQAALPGFELGDYIRESVTFLREHEPPEGFFVGFSGGKDSIVTLALCRLAGVRHVAFYSCPRIDPPEVARHIRREYPEVVWLYPRMSMWEGVRRYGPPLRYRRWCCDLLKKQPARLHPLKHRVGYGLARRGKRPQGGPASHRGFQRPDSLQADFRLARMGGMGSRGCAGPFLSLAVRRGFSPRGMRGLSLYPWQYAGSGQAKARKHAALARHLARL